MTTTTDQPQHLEALDRANRIRLARAEVKREIRAGTRSVVELLAPGQTLPSEIESMRVFELLCAQRRWGRSRALKVLTPLVIRENRRLCELTDRQRGDLVRKLEGHKVERRRLAAA